MHRALLPLFTLSLTGCLFTQQPVEAPDTPCQDDVRCPAGTVEVLGCTDRAGVTCETLTRCDGSTLTCQGDDVVCSPAACEAGDREVGRCATSAPDGPVDSLPACAAICAGEGCYEVEGCGEIVYCEPPSCEPPPECATDQTTASSCPPSQGVSCEERIRCDGTVFACISPTVCSEPASCPRGFAPVARCELSEPTCREGTQCGEPILCQAVICDDINKACERLGGAECAEGDVNGCISVDVCGTQVSCQFEQGCAPQRATAAGRCQGDETPLWRWTGTTCEQLNGCGCMGPDCMASAPLASNESKCLDLHAQCNL